MADLRRRTVIIETKLGRLRLMFSSRGATSVEFYRPRSARFSARLGRSRSEGRSDEPVFMLRATKQLQAYADGQPVRFTIPLDLRAGTAFQQTVWRALRMIPHGETRSYAWVARKIGKPTAARAVGAACGANPVPIFAPCHRVVASDGSLGGFSGGLPLKRRLLKLEAQ